MVSSLEIYFVYTTCVEGGVWATCHTLPAICDLRMRLINATAVRSLVQESQTHAGEGGAGNDKPWLLQRFATFLQRRLT